MAGAVGSMIPDALEPATSSWHRSFAHSHLASVAIPAVTVPGIIEWQERCRITAEEHQTLAAQATDGWSRFWHQFLAFVWHMLSGAAVGLVAGYLSHLVLDSTTPRGLPVIA